MTDGLLSEGSKIDYAADAEAVLADLDKDGSGEPIDTRPKVDSNCEMRTTGWVQKGLKHTGMPALVFFFLLFCGAGSFFFSQAVVLMLVWLTKSPSCLFKVDCQSRRSSVPHSVRQSMVRNPIFALQEVFQTSQHLRILISKFAMPNGHSYNVFPSFQSGCVELVSLDTFPVGLLYFCQQAWWRISVSDLFARSQEGETDMPLCWVTRCLQRMKHGIWHTAPWVR